MVNRSGAGPGCSGSSWSDQNRACRSQSFSKRDRLAPPRTGGRIGLLGGILPTASRKRELQNRKIQTGSSNRQDTSTSCGKTSARRVDNDRSEKSQRLSAFYQCSEFN